MSDGASAYLLNVRGVLLLVAQERLQSRFADSRRFPLMVSFAMVEPVHVRDASSVKHIHKRLLKRRS